MTASIFYFDLYSPSTLAIFNGERTAVSFIPKRHGNPYEKPSKKQTLTINGRAQPVSSIRC